MNKPPYQKGTCHTGQSYSSLSSSDHTFMLRGEDDLGNLSQPLSYSWKIDNEEPTVELLQYPKSPTNSSTANLVWSITESSGIKSQECLHNDHPISCSGLSHQLTNLPEGSHSFQVKVTDRAKNIGESIKYTWWVDKTPPTLNITSTPDAFTQSATATFTFSATDLVSSTIKYKCRIDNQKPTDCQSPYTYSSTTNLGSHKFYVIATDEAGNPSDEESYSWTIDRADPMIQFTQTPADHTTSQSSTISIMIHDLPPGKIDSIQCGFTGSPTSCTSPHSETFTNLDAGSYSFTVTATDMAGNTYTLSHSWEVTEASIVCDPFTTTNNECPSQGGVHGNLYYFNKNDMRKNTALLDDYPKLGIKHSSTIHLSQINVPLIEFTEGFLTNDGEFLTDNGGNKLVTFFSLRLKGFIQPNTGSTNQSYEFSILIDDGARILLDGETILEDNRIHLPRWKCTTTSYEFAPNEKKSFEIHYFQGPPNLMAMQIVYRVEGRGTGCPVKDYDDYSLQGWKLVPSKFFAEDDEDNEDDKTD